MNYVQFIATKQDFPNLVTKNSILTNNHTAGLIIHKNSVNDRQLDELLSGKDDIYAFEDLIYKGIPGWFSFSHYDYILPSIKLEFNLEVGMPKFITEIPIINESHRQNKIDELVWQLHNSKEIANKHESLGMGGTDNIILAAYKVKNDDSLIGLTIDGVAYKKEGVKLKAKHLVSVITCNRDSGEVFTFTDYEDYDENKANEHYEELKNKINPLNLSEGQSDPDDYRGHYAIIGVSHTKKYHQDIIEQPSLIENIYGMEIITNSGFDCLQVPGNAVDREQVMKDFKNDYLLNLNSRAFPVMEQELKYKVPSIDEDNIIKLAIYPCEVISLNTTYYEQ